VDVWPHDPVVFVFLPHSKTPTYGYPAYPCFFEKLVMTKRLCVTLALFTFGEAMQPTRSHPETTNLTTQGNQPNHSLYRNIIMRGVSRMYLNAKG
jgi:hypothetical protein